MLIPAHLGDKSITYSTQPAKTSRNLWGTTRALPQAVALRPVGASKQVDRIAKGCQPGDDPVRLVRLSSCIIPLPETVAQALPGGSRARTVSRVSASAAGLSVRQRRMRGKR